MRKVAATAILMLASAPAAASNVTEFPDNGSEQMGRGGAWVARASDPLATFYNPAGLAGQPTKLTIQVNLPFQQTCFSRVQDPNDTTIDTLSGGPGMPFPKVCNDLGTFPVPSIGFTFRATPRLGIGLLIFAPSGAAGGAWPEFLPNANGQLVPAPERYLATYTNAFFLNPTLGVGWEPIDRLRIGAAFVGGIANAQFSDGAMSINNTTEDPRSNDIKAHLSTATVFVPGFTLGAIWSPTPMLDVAGWYKFSAPVDASADVTTYANYYNLSQTPVVGNSAQKDCGTGQPSFDTVCVPGAGHVKLAVPMEAKLGVRLHKPRHGLGLEGMSEHRRDPMAQEIWDLELDLTWANDSAMNNLNITFPSSPALPVNGVPAGVVPPNASVPFNFNDVIGVRLGGDYNVIPNRLAVRAGTFFESEAASTDTKGNANYMNTDFAAGARVGLALGATVRIPLKKNALPTEGGALELSVGYMHMFVTTLTNSSATEGVHALAGTPCETGTVGANGLCANNMQPYRSTWLANLGTITNALDVINIGASYRF
jgi:long-subunit fatty acid transport protein